VRRRSRPADNGLYQGAILFGARWETCLEAAKAETVKRSVLRILE
jgi:hypothetical protein